MAYQKLQSGDFMVCGYVPKDAEMKTVGQNNSSKTTFSIKASEVQKPDGSKEANWTNCVAWHDNARVCASIKKGDFVLAIGHIEESEYNGKTYRNLVVEYVSKSGAFAPSIAATAESDSNGNSGDPLGDLSGFEEISADGDCPF